MAGSWIPMILLGGGIAGMALLSAIATPDEKKKVIYIEKDLAGKKGIRRKKKNSSGGGGGTGDDDAHKGFHPTTPWGGNTR